MQPRKLFLIDSLGACLTAFLLIAVVARFEKVFGIPYTAVTILFIIAGIFSVYSMACYLFAGKNPRPFLRIIAIANLLYCCLTLAVVIFFWSGITTLGLIYFIGELIIIVCLSMVELKTIRHA